MRLCESELAKLTPLERLALDSFLLAKWLEGAANARLDVLAELANDGFSIDAADPDGFTALMVGAAEGRSEVVRFLLERKADTRKQTAELRLDALHLAIRSGHVHIVKLLCEADSSPAHIDSVDGEGDSALICACAEGQPDIVTELIKSGAEASQTNAYGASALMCALSSGGGIHVDAQDRNRCRILRELLDRAPTLINSCLPDGARVSSVRQRGLQP